MLPYARCIVEQAMHLDTKALGRQSLWESASSPAMTTSMASAVGCGGPAQPCYLTSARSGIKHGARGAVYATPFTPWQLLKCECICLSECRSSNELQRCSLFVGTLNAGAVLKILIPRLRWELARVGGARVEWNLEWSCSCSSVCKATQIVRYVWT